MVTVPLALPRRVRRIARYGADLALLLAGCTVGPDFKRPDAPSTEHYLPATEVSATANPSVALGTKVTADWWTLFRAPVIDTLVKDAIASSPTLDSAKAKLASARAAITEASAALYPQVGFNAGVTRERRSGSEFGLSSVSLPPNFNVFQLGPTASYDLDLFGGTRRQIEERASEADFQEDQLDAAYVTLTGNTVTEAIALADATAELRAIDDTIDIDRKT
jgi:outer membrane protein TolC